MHYDLWCTHTRTKEALNRFTCFKLEELLFKANQDHTVNVPLVLLYRFVFDFLLFGSHAMNVTAFKWEKGWRLSK